MRRLLAALAAVPMVLGLAGTPAVAQDGRQTYTGEIDGAEYRVEMPANWNGTLLLYSHGYAPEGFPTEIALTNRPEPFGRPSELWLLDHGYALAASNVNPPTGYHVRRGLRDQINLLDWVEANIGRPQRTIATGQSLGGALAVQLVEEHPERFAGAATFCAGYDPLGQFNTVLDTTFVIKTLLAPGEDIDLVRARDPQASFDALQRAIDRASATPAGRARLALAAAMNNVTGWYSARLPEPVTPTDRILQQKEWLKNAYAFLGTLGRAELEQQAGGNPSWNTGIDYGRQLVKSAQTEWVTRAYADAGLSLPDDLAMLARTPRIAADPQAVEFLRDDVPTGRTPVPMLALHSTGDGGAVTDQERWLAEQVRKHGDPRKLRKLWVHRGGHCTISGAEEILAVQAVDQRVRTGQWPSLSPARMNAAAAALGPQLSLVFDFSTFTDAPDTPKFTEFQPPRYLRPSA